MNKKEFYKIYLPALKQALLNDDGINIPDPEYYIKDDQLAKNVSEYIDTETEDDFLNLVGYYLDSRAHNFPDVGEISIDECKKRIIEEIRYLENTLK